MLEDDTEMSSGIMSDKRIYAVIVIAILLPIVFVFWPGTDFERYILSAVIVVVLFALLLLVYRDSSKQPKVVTKEDLVETYVPGVEETDALLMELPVETIEGIGETYGTKLRAVGIENVQDLLESDAETIAKACDVSTSEAGQWIAMGRFAWLDGISEEDAEAIVLGTGITEVLDLSDEDPKDLYQRVMAAVEKGDVRIPAGYEFTIEKVRTWIEAAKSVID
jgi:hypothetical protein